MVQQARANRSRFVKVKCPDCEKVTQEEIEATGLGEALAWCADKYLPAVPTNTPAAALLASSFAVAGLVAIKHPKVKHYLEGIEQQVEEIEQQTGA